MNYVFEVTQQDAQLIMGVLAQLPFQQSAGLIQRLSDQVRAQDAANAVPVDFGNKWQHAAENLLEPGDYERLKQMVET